MFFPKRWTLLCTTIAAALFLFLTLQYRVLPEARPYLFSALPTAYSRAKSCPTVPPRKVPDLKQSGFDWRNVVVKNPIKIEHELPKGQARDIPKIQWNQFNELSAKQRRRRDAVKETFVRGWNAYREEAWMDDEIMPISGGGTNPFGGWAATLVDSLDTLWIMDMKAEFVEAVTAVSKISFDPDKPSLEFVNMFETTIRYLGGFLAAYDLTDCKDERLLQKAVQVGDMIYASYDTPNRMPVTRWKIRNHEQKMLAAQHGIIAELASASLEFTRLSQLTGDMKYYDAVMRITNLLDENQHKTQLPGMFPTDIKPREGNFSTGTTFGFGAMADSAYEYFGKTWQLLGGRVPQYKKLYEDSMNVAATHLMYRPSLPDQADVLITSNWHAGPKTRYTRYDYSDHRDAEFQHLSCFAGGMYLLGARLFGNDTHGDIGQRLTHGCVWAYRNSPNGIMPEVVAMKPCPTMEECPYHEKQISPFTMVTDPRYVLRPEAIESVFYAYRITGDEKYQDIAWNMFRAIEKHTKVKFGNAAIKNVMKKEIEHEDSTESFWFSETLKYFYLIFSDLELISLDDWVFNTEAHPFRIPRG